MDNSNTQPYSVAIGASEAFNQLLKQAKSQIPKEFRAYSGNVKFVPSRYGDQVYFPSPCREQDVIAAIKALEACAAAAIGDLRHGEKPRSIKVDLDKAACFLMSAYLATIDGKRKGETPKGLIPDTDYNQAQSIQYRRLSANLYETKEDGRYYHIHGSLDATTQLRMLNLPPFNPQLTDYKKCIDTIEAAVKKFTVAELEEMNTKHGQAGVEALKWEDFLKTSHGKSVSALPPFTVEAIKVPQATMPETPPHTPTEANFQSSLWSKGPIKEGPQYALRGIKVIEMCRVIAGPTIGRSLAAHGAQVLKVTGPKLPDVPFFQVDVNTGKHTTHLDLRNPTNLKTFQNLLAEADVLIDGYRPGALARFGCDPASLAKLAQQRGNRGFIYVAEDCFGGTGVTGAEWAGRRGWQQIADCVTGVAWAQGKFMGLNEPSVPPMPMSDYGTGALGCVAAMAGLYQRETRGGSWMCRTSLCQYDIFLLKLGLLPRLEQERLRKVFTGPFFKLRHYDSVDKVSGEALKAMQRAYPHLFGPELMLKTKSEGFKCKEIRWPKEAIAVDWLLIKHERASRPNGFDEPCWGDWARDLILDDGDASTVDQHQNQQQQAMTSGPQRRSRIATVNTVLATA